MRMTKKNPRTKRAEDALITATRELVAGKPVDSITLTEVAKAAGVSRPTLYNLFDSVDSLVAETATRFIDGILASTEAAIEEKDSKDYLDDLMRGFVAGVYAERGFARNVMYGPAASRVFSYVVGLLSTRMSDRYIGKRLNASDSSRSDDIQAISAGVVWLLTEWLKSDFKGCNSPESMASRLSDVLYRLSDDRDIS